MAAACSHNLIGRAAAVTAALMLVFLYSCSTVSQSRRQMNDLVSGVIEKSLTTLDRSAREIADTNTFPTYGRENLTWKTKPSKDWVSGFYGGCQWYAYALSGDPIYETYARQWTSGIEKEKYNTHTHDLGFRFMCTFGNGVRFAPEQPFTKDYAAIRDTAAVTLSHRFHPEFGALSSDWDKEPIEGTTPCVIDIMMNLEILFEAAKSLGNQRLYDMAVSHAQTTWRDFVREDGGTYHVVRYSTEDGAIVDRGQLQGDVKESTWSRGHAWLVYGLVVTYRYTGDTVYLDWAERAADYFIAGLREDGVAPWDFQCEDNQSDASASAVVVSALYEMITYLPKDKADYYGAKADMMLSALCDPQYFVAERSQCLLDHSVQYYHQKHNVNRPAIFADYYFMEALYRYKNLYL